MRGRISYLFPRKAWYLKGRVVLSIRRLVYLVYLRLKRKLGQDYSFSIPEESSVPIDIFMPTLEKDATMLKHAIDYARLNIKHPISNIYVVSSGDSKVLKKLAKDKDCVYIEEKDVLPGLEKKYINYSYNGFDKNGWIYKMLLNLNAHNVCKEDNILVLDSDTLFILPQILLYKNRPLFNLSDEYYDPYYQANKHILGVPHKLSRSFITHYMLFNRDVLASMHKHLEDKWNKPWHMAIIDNLDKSTPMAFADYESYGDYYLAKGPNRPHLNYWSNLSGKLKDFHLDSFIELALKAKVFRSISLHTFLKKTTQKHEE